MTQDKQTGSVVSFVVIGGVLVLTAAGVLYWAGQQRTGTDDVARTPEVTLPSSNENITPEATKQDGKTDKDSSAPGKDMSSENKPSDDSAQDGTARSDSKKNQSPDGNEVTELSRTGPSDSIVNVLAAGMLTGSIVAFAQSRRRETTL